MLVVFFILSIKTVGLGTYYGILIMQAKFHVLRLKHKQLPCWQRHSASTLPPTTLGNMIPQGC